MIPNGRKWERVWGPKKENKYKITNAEFARIDKDFNAACESGHCKPTARQASKWRNRKGRAWAAR